MIRRCVTLLLLICQHLQAAECIAVNAEQPLPGKTADWTIAAIELQRNDIFDLNKKHVVWFHYLANDYHVITSEQAIRDDLLFQTGQRLDPALLNETERLLRSRRYLRHAEVSVSHYCPADNTVKVKVSSWDNWSLLPKISLGHEGGETKTNLGFAEDNLWGTGNQLMVEYFSDSERHGYKTRFLSPNISGSHWQTALQYADNSDGETYQFRLNKPFYQLGSERSYGFEVFKDIKDISEYQRGDVYNEYQSKVQYLSVDTGWKLSQQGHTVQRLSVGVKLDDRHFSANEYSTLPPPPDRDLSQVWLGFEWFESNYQKLHNFYLFNRVEDINFGWQFGARVGALSTSLGAYSAGMQYQLFLNKTWAVGQSSWLVLNSDLNLLDATKLPQQRLFNTQLRYIKHLSDNQVWLSQLRVAMGDNLFRDERIAIGGDEGMRAFPLYYQTGDKAIIASSEYRYITPWHVYQLFDVAIAAFVDAGRAWDNPDQQIELDQGRLYGYGIGLRLLPSHASRGSIISIDLSKPVTNNPELSGWRWRFIAKKEF